MGETVPISIQGGQIHVHTEVLISTSDFLKNVMKLEWRADKNCPIDFSKEDPKVVETYCRWLYSGKISCCENPWTTSKITCQLFILGEKLVDQTFKNAVLDFMIENFSSKPKVLPNDKSVKIIYDGTPKGSPARRLVVDIWAYCMTPLSIGLSDLTCLRGTDYFEELIPALVAVRSVTPREKIRPWVAQPESYHERSCRWKKCRNWFDGKHLRRNKTHLVVDGAMLCTHTHTHTHTRTYTHGYSLVEGKEEKIM